MQKISRAERRFFSKRFLRIDSYTLIPEGYRPASKDDIQEGAILYMMFVSFRKVNSDSQLQIIRKGDPIAIRMLEEPLRISELDLDICNDKRLLLTYTEVCYEIVGQSLECFVPLSCILSTIKISFLGQHKYISRKTSDIVTLYLAKK